MTGESARAADPPDAPSAPVAIYGASGYTGRLVAEQLARRGVPIVLVGRDAERLRAVAEPFGELVSDVAVAGLEDPVALRAAFARVAVVANCAGPFAITGAPILSAAIDAGVHYLDTTGEQTWMRRVFDDFASPLEHAGVAAVPGMGFDYVPGDLLCHLVGSRCAPLSELLVAYHVHGFGMTRGTMRSSLEMLRGGDVFYRDGRWQPADGGPRRTFVTFPAPVGRRLMGKYPSGEVITVPRHVSTRRVQSLIAADTLAGGPFAALLPPLLPAIGRLMRTPLASALDRAIGRLPEGPGVEERRAAKWTIVCRATGEDGTRARGVVRGSDIYGLTGHTIAEGAVRMASPQFSKAGALAPASAFDAERFLGALEPVGVSWVRE